MRTHRSPTNTTNTLVDASWLTPETLRAAKQRASAIVVARVTKITQAPDNLISVPGEPGGVVRSPSQRINFDVLKSLKSNVGNQFVLGHWGTDATYIKDDPPYRIGETYVLFLEPMEKEPNYLSIAPAVRYRVINDQIELMPEVNIPYAVALRGKTIAELEKVLANIPN